MGRLLLLRNDFGQDVNARVTCVCHRAVMSAETTVKAFSLDF